MDADYLRTRPWKAWSRLLSYALFEGRPLTTRGRWFNPVVFANLAVAGRLPPLRKVETPVFILGTGRSGTTVLGIVLSMHRRVGYLNEPKALWHRICAEEDLVGNYSAGPARYRLSAQDATELSVTRARRLYSAYLLATMSSRVVDKYPELVFRVPFVRALFPDARFLFLVRNGWDTVTSIERWSDRHGVVDGSQVHDWWGVDRRKWRLLVDQVVPGHADLASSLEQIRRLDSQTDMAAVEWIVSMREGLAAINEFPDSILRVDYETLCGSPGSTLESIFDFARLPGDATALRYAETVLRTNRRRERVALHPAIEGPFHETLASLGYAD